MSCRYCYDTKHNVTTCEKLRKDADPSQPPSLTRARAQQRVARLEGKKEHRKKIGKACSYCHKSGHTKPTCAKIKEDRTKAIEQNSKFRHHVAEIFSSLGIGPGCMLSIPKQWNLNSTEEQSVLLIIEKIIWENVIWRDSPVTMIMNLNGERKPYFDMALNDNFLWALGRGRITVVVPVPLEYTKMYPKNWLNGESSIIDQTFVSKRDVIVRSY